MELKRAGDIMIPLDKYPHIPYWFTLRQAIVELEKSELDIEGRKSLPRILLVFDEAYKLLGMIRRRDILRGLEPKFLSSQPLDYRKKLFNVKVDPTLFELSSEKIVKGIREQAERTVSEVMLPIVATADWDGNIIKVIYEMVDNNVSLLPVLRDGKVVGVLRSVDVFHEIARVLLE